MAHINLLPWREEARKAKEKEFYTILVALSIVVFFIVLVISQVYQARVDGQKQKNQFLTSEIQILDIRIGEIKTLNSKKDALKNRTNVVEQLQRSRNVGTQVLDELAKIVPTGVYLISMEKQENILKVTGKSESNNHLANMIREIEHSDFFSDAVLESITTDEGKSKILSDFRMTIRIRGLDAAAKGGRK